MSGPTKDAAAILERLSVQVWQLHSKTPEGEAQVKSFVEELLAVRSAVLEHEKKRIGLLLILLPTLKAGKGLSTRKVSWYIATNPDATWDEKKEAICAFFGIGFPYAQVRGSH